MELAPAVQFFHWRKWRRQDLDSGGSLRFASIAIAAQRDFGAGDPGWEKAVRVGREIRRALVGISLWRAPSNLAVRRVEQRTATEYLRLARVVPFSNTDIEIVRGSSESRRRYLDFVGFQIDPRYRATLRAYERALRSRNALLKAAQPRPRELAAYDKPLLEHGIVLGEMRAKLVARLGPLVAAAYRANQRRQRKSRHLFCAGKRKRFRRPPGSLVFAGTAPSANGGRSASRRFGFVRGWNAGQGYASEGQQRTFALALKIAQARVFAEEAHRPRSCSSTIFLASSTRNGETRCSHRFRRDRRSWLPRRHLQWRTSQDRLDGSALFHWRIAF